MHPAAHALQMLLSEMGLTLPDTPLVSLSTETPDSSIAENPGPTMELVAQDLKIPARFRVVTEEELLHRELADFPILIHSVGEQSTPHYLGCHHQIGPILRLTENDSSHQWLTRAGLVQRCPGQIYPLSTARWRAGVLTQAGRAGLAQRFGQLGLDGGQADAMVEEAALYPGWRGLATLDAALRMVAALAAQDGVSPGQPALALLQAIYKRAIQEENPVHPTIPEHHWRVRPDPSANNKGDQKDGDLLLRVQGIGLLEIKPQSPNELEKSAPQTESSPGPAKRPTWLHLGGIPRTSRLLWQLLRADGLLTPGLTAWLFLIAGAGVVLQVVLFRGFMQLAGPVLPTMEARSQALGLLLLIALLFALVRWLAQSLTLRMGRTLEMHLRTGLLGKIATLSSAYLQTLTPGELAERIYGLRRLRYIPSTGGTFLFLIAQLLAILCAVAWLDPLSLPFLLIQSLLGAGGAIAAALLLGPISRQIRAESGLLSRLNLDALLGITPLTVHSGQRAMRRLYESVLTRRVNRQSRMQRIQVLFWLGLESSYHLLAVGMVLAYLTRTGQVINALLLLSWAYSAFLLAERMMLTSRQYISQQTDLQRVLEPLEAPAEATFYPVSLPQPEGAAPPPPSAAGVALGLRHVAVSLAGSALLHDINLTIPAGSHLAVVGPSGAGKTTLAELLLGHHRPSRGQLLVDGEALTYKGLMALRQGTVWISPSSQIWNRSLLYNLRYGTSAQVGGPAADALLERADLKGVASRLPDGLRTRLGEAGRRLSGGEGQRVRYARGLGRPDARLVILDEAFRGLDRQQRAILLADARAYWPTATLICITHDLDQSQNFERVVVIEDGKVVADGNPAAMMQMPDSRYRDLVQAEVAVQEQLWSPQSTAATWRRLHLAQGRMGEEQP